jgi:hypothetical protein
VPFIAGSVAARSLAGAVLFALSASGASAQTAQPTAQTATAKELVHSFASVAISPDGKRVVSVESTDPGPDAVNLPATTIVVRTHRKSRR